jgi:hypothetical protein
MNEFGPRVLLAVGCGEVAVEATPEVEELLLTRGVGEVISFPSVLAITPAR